MNDTQLVELLAQREGWKFETTEDGGPMMILVTRPNGHQYYINSPIPKNFLRYTESLDSLQPILATLTDEEWYNFAKEVERNFDSYSADRHKTFAQLYLLLKPSQLARCIGKVIAPKGE